MDPTDMIDDRLTATLNAATRAMPVTPGKPGKAIRRAKQIRYRRRRIGRLTTSAVLVVATVGVIQLTTNDHDRQVTVIGSDDGAADSVSSSPSAVPQPGGPANSSVVETAARPPTISGDIATIVESPFEWSMSEPTRRIGFDNALTSDTHTKALYAVSTQPGVQAQPIPKDIIRSIDGVSWENVAPWPNSNSYPRQLAAFDGQLYSLGTAPVAGGADASEPVIRTLAPTGEWQTTRWPGLDFPALQSKYSGAASYRNLAIASGPRGTLAALAVRVAIDESHLLEVAPNAWRSYSTPAVDGVIVYDPPCPVGFEPDDQKSDQPDAIVEDPTCLSSSGEHIPMVSTNGLGPERLVTWQDLGVTAEETPLYQAGLRWYLSTDGATFTEVSLAVAPSPGTESVHLWADAEGFVAVIFPRNQSEQGERRPAPAQVLSSSDGITWTEADQLADTTWIYNVGRVDGQIVVVRGSVDDELTIERLTAQGWQTTGTQDLLASAIGQPGQEFPRQAAFGPGGIAVALTWSPFPSGGNEATIRHPEFSLVVGLLNFEYRVLDSAGTEIDSWTHDRAFATQRVKRRVDSGIAVFDDAGVAVDVFTAQEIDAVRSAANFESSGPYIAYTTDLGATWSVTSTDQVANATVESMGDLAFTPLGGLTMQVYSTTPAAGSALHRTIIARPVS